MFRDWGQRRPPGRWSERPHQTGVCLSWAALLKRGLIPMSHESSMISRYTRPEMASIWEAQTRFKIWFEIEAHAADALAELGVIPKEAAKTIWAKAKDATFDVARIDEIERETKHDVIAFLTHLAEIVGPEARFVHQGMTSSDVLDTCLNVQLTRAADLLIADIDKVLAALKTRAFEIGSPLCAPGHALVRRARHLPQRAAYARRRPADRRYRQGAGCAEDARLRDRKPALCPRACPRPTCSTPASTCSLRAPPTC